MKTAVVIGANGQDGYYMAGSLEKEGCTVIRIDQGSIQPHGIVTTAEPFDICNPLHADQLVKEIQPDEIYHLAAFHQSAQDDYVESMEILDKSLQVNEVSVFNLLTAIKKYAPKCRFFYAASSLIFGEPECELQTENTPINPVTLYGITKASGLFLCRKFRKEHGIFAACGIMYNHESPRRQANFLSKKIITGVENALQDKHAVLELGNLSASADWGYAPDYVEAMKAIMALPNADDFIVATGIKHTVRDFVSTAYSAAGLNWMDHVKESAGIVKRVTQPLIGDASKLRNLTGWHPTLDFEQMVNQLVLEGVNLGSSRP